jgi:hypothetical protein
MFNCDFDVPLKEIRLYLKICRLALERLLRKVLRMTHSPAIINLHYHIFGVEDTPMARLQPHYWSGAQV